MKFQLTSKFSPTGDQPQAIKKLIEGLRSKYREQTLLGVTGSGKTFTMANVIQAVQKPTLIISPNKTLAAQLAQEMKEFFPYNAVHYFVSYYDYYQPEAYLPAQDLYIAKDSAINEEIDKLRHATTQSLISRNDVIIVATVSCIYGVGSREEYEASSLRLKTKTTFQRTKLLSKLIDMQYVRNNMTLERGQFQVLGETIKIRPTSDEEIIQLEFDGEELANIKRFILTDQKLSLVAPSEDLEEVMIFPAKHFMTSEEYLPTAIKNIQAEMKERVKYFRKHDKLIEAQRIEERTLQDVAMLKSTGYCNGVENYSRHIERRKEGTPPTVLVDFFPKDFLMFIDESHITIPQIRGMYLGDKARKESLVDYGWRLPSAKDNRPLNWNEFYKKIKQAIYVSATPAAWEEEHSSQVVEQILRPTGLLDPEIIVRPTKDQIPDVIKEINATIKKGQRVLVTTLTKRLSEDLSTYLTEQGIKTLYLHSDIDTVERMLILNKLRKGGTPPRGLCPEGVDVLVGINLLREGLDLPEVSLIVILDADKEGFLRSPTSLMQTSGRAARHQEGRVIMYADKITKAMKYAIDETKRRRKLQEEYNKKHGITPKTIVKDIRAPLVESGKGKKKGKYELNWEDQELSLLDNLSERKLGDLDRMMRRAAKEWRFEEAVQIRDEIRRRRVKS